jgi:hypothetical protein
VGEPTHLHNVEYLVLSGDQVEVDRCVSAVAERIAHAHL